MKVLSPSITTVLVRVQTGLMRGVHFINLPPSLEKLRGGAYSACCENRPVMICTPPLQKNSVDPSIKYFSEYRHGTSMSKQSEFHACATFLVKVKREVLILPGEIGRA